MTSPPIPTQGETPVAVVAPQNPNDIEEGGNVYRPGGFHPVYIGDVYNDRYKVLNKIGYGVYSTVWLVKDLQHETGNGNEYLALKVLSAECHQPEKPVWEKEILTYLRDGDRRQLGYAYVCHLVDDFELQGPNGVHVCLLFELMGETLRSFGTWFNESMVPNSVMHRFTIQLLLALDFAHEHDVIHTDIKPDNIFVKFRDHSLIESYRCNIPLPQQDRSEEHYTVIPSRPLRGYYFNESDHTKVDQFDIALGDWGVARRTTEPLRELIQPVALRAPEVLIGAPWGAKVDWWNLGAVVLEVSRAVRMFSGQVPRDGPYQLKEHLAEIVDIFGPFPKSLLEKGDQEIVKDLFDEDGRVKDAEPMNRPGLASDAFTPGLREEVRGLFVSFLYALMKLDPSERLSTEDLLRHPWLGAMK